jgi:hypothetical protein
MSFTIVPRKRSTRSPCGALSIAEGLLCPHCKRAIQTYDFESIDPTAFQIICGGCHLTLVVCEE